MPAYSDGTRKYHLERVRSVLAMNPNATFDQILEKLSRDPEHPLSFDRGYLSRLLRKIGAERRHRYDQAEIDSRLAEMEDEFNMLRERLWDITTNPGSKPRETIFAIKTLSQIDLMFFECQMNAGIFERAKTKVAEGQKYEMSPEHKAAFIKAFGQAGIRLE